MSTELAFPSMMSSAMVPSRKSATRKGELLRPFGVAGQALSVRAFHLPAAGSSPTLDEVTGRCSPVFLFRNYLFINC